MRRYMSLKNVTEYLEVGKTKVYDEMNRKDFPKSFKILGNVRWDLKEIDEWVEEKKAKQREEKEVA